MYDTKLRELDNYYLNNHNKFILIGIIHSFTSTSFSLNKGNPEDVELLTNILKVEDLHDIELSLFNHHDYHNDVDHSILLNEFELCSHVHKDQSNAHIDIVKGIIWGVFLQILTLVTIFSTTIILDVFCKQTISISFLVISTVSYLLLSNILMVYGSRIINKILK